MECNFVSAGCSMNSRCYWGRLNLNCDGKSAYINDTEQPGRILVSKNFRMADGRLSPSKPLYIDNSEGLTLADLALPSEKAVRFARKNNIEVGFDALEEMSVSLNDGTKLYKHQVGDETISGEKKDLKYSCNWTSYPSLISSTCDKGKAMCVGNVTCTDLKTGATISGTADCSSKSGGGNDCSDASSCASSEDKNYVNEVRSCAGTAIKVSGEKNPVVVPKSK